MSTEYRQIRLALTCFGGVSLAIYMHGVTKELQALVKASKLLTAEPNGKPQPSGTVDNYLRALKRYEKRTGVRPQVFIDIISGTSAGGINGVVLAKALLKDGDQTPLTDLWLHRGNFGKIIVRRVWDRIANRARSLVSGSRQDFFYNWVLEGLDALDGQPPNGPLLPSGHPLDLFVTMTDLYGVKQRRMFSNGQRVEELKHKQVLHFEHSNARTSFGQRESVMLAFAARATASFPGAFAPVDLSLVKAALKRLKDPERLTDFKSEFFGDYADANPDCEHATFIDGGVLDNRPFGHSIDAIGRRSAGCEVDRHLIYIHPHPDNPKVIEKLKRPGIFRTVKSSLSGLPRTQPILEQLEEVDRLNEHARLYRQILLDNYAELKDLLETLSGGAERPSAAATDALYDVLRGGPDRKSDERRFSPVIGYGAYVKLKLSDTVDRYAQLAMLALGIQRDSPRGSRLVSVVRLWARDAGVLPQPTQHSVSKPSESQLDFLKRFDLAFGRRRIKLLVRRINDYYDAGIRDWRRELDESKKLLYGLIERLTPEKALSESIRKHKHDLDLTRLYALTPEEYLKENQDTLNEIWNDLGAIVDRHLADIGNAMEQTVERVAENLQTSLGRELLIIYYGFPYWDTIMFPLAVMSDAAEKDPIDVVRFSPDDAKLLWKNEETHRLKGVGLRHFKAFFKRRYRENDYLWGRLDAAELILRLLEENGFTSADSFDDFRRSAKDAFTAILDEETKSKRLRILQNKVRRDQFDALVRNV